ncbi:hypothetical protein PSA7680_02934 [Pseudoruegeria aquimaris]|uniref:Uncharacterized protein n=1 Tax=Pseudoruegeria aquimaris TaxID=393663 RepID=A0A1Y5T8C3_9RHOB|nr:DUF5665 domain-containing protein [Pseudoruegeria aquimaris]SLN56242.1 hypothetical protein PSA7680_02934 [Pseudoruegeria aquimaris]
MSTDQDKLNEELAGIRRELEIFNNHRIVRINNNIWRTLMFQFARGLALGLGTVIGASVLVSAVIYSLSKIDFIPIVGDWASEIAQEIQAGQNGRNTPVESAGE